MDETRNDERAPGFHRRRWAFGATIADFLDAEPDRILGSLIRHADFPVDLGQRNAWAAQIAILKGVLDGAVDRGALYFEYAIPRLGKRVDVVLVLDHVLFVLEFKIGERSYPAHAIDQVWDYALDLKNFHGSSHAIPVAPVLVATAARGCSIEVTTTHHQDNLLSPIRTNAENLGAALDAALAFVSGPAISAIDWERGRYQPTPTIVEAATALYAGHSVEEISRSDAGAKNLQLTSSRINEIIQRARSEKQKAICFVTGVPGAGKTLVGLDVATRHIDKDSALYSVFLSGNGPLVAVLREALARDKVRRSKLAGKPVRLGEARSEVKLFIQNVHHFRDDCLADPDKPPLEHVALFDEAQRAWSLEQTARFMRQKKSTPQFGQSEPEFLISCLDRHADWAVVVCLVGSGQEINTGEAGITGWVDAILHRFLHWQVHLSPRLIEVEYRASRHVAALAERNDVHHDESLHLSVSVRSFRSESVAAFVNQFLDLDSDSARRTLAKVLPRYPIRITRNLEHAKRWLRHCARGTERYGMVVSSQAQRLRPHAIDVRVKVDPVHWFLDGRNDVRSSYFLEDVATEFQVQGLELDWSCLVWDGDLRLDSGSWDFFGFAGNRWQRILKEHRRRYLLNAYRVLLTRARQGMVIVVPEGDPGDPTRRPDFYDSTFEHLRRTGIPELEPIAAS